MIAVIGGGLSGLAAAYQLHKEGLPFQLFEASSYLGGAVRTFYRSDMVLEGGADSILRSKPQALELVEELGLSDQVVETIPEYRGSLLLRDGELYEIPEGVRLMAPAKWLSFVRSPLISFPGKLRAAADLFLPAKTDGEDESLGQFVARRLGQEMLDYMAQPMISGIYGADPHELSLRATMPMFQELEEKYGSVIRGLRKTGGAESSTGARYSLFFNLKRGSGALVEALAESLPQDQLFLDAKVSNLKPGWTLEVAGEERSFESVLVATPASAAARLTQFDPDLSSVLGSVKSHPAVTVNLIFKRSDCEGIPLAYGFIVPAAEERELLACTFTSYKWPDRGPEEYEIIRAYFGGPSFDKKELEKSDVELVQKARTELGQIFGLVSSPEDYLVDRHFEGIPIYEVGHRERVLELKKLEASHNGLFITGNYLDGVGVPDVIRGGRETARRVAESCARTA